MCSRLPILVNKLLDLLFNSPFLQHRDMLESYVMDRVGEKLWKDMRASHADQDSRYEFQRAALASFVTPENLDVRGSVPNEVVIKLVESSLQELNTTFSPLKKLNAVVQSCKIVMRDLNLGQ